ncbi:MAG: nucleotide exchange factor GrpE [Candidatus Tectomicrobia bacterium]|nr:nucleotide exchange factor GrpE [Candidatus Tectomicrobia bacterium]
METKEQQPAPEEPLAEDALPGEALMDESSEASQEDDVAEAEGIDAVETGVEETPYEAEVLSVDDLQVQLAEQRQQTQEYLDQLQRLQADFSNYRRRMAQERSQAAVRGKEEVLMALLPVVGNLRLALQHADQDANAVREGVQMIWQQCEDFMRQQGVEQIATVGEPFDPALHEALTMAPVTDETPANTIVAEINAGYTLHGQLLRAAQVVVAQAEPAAAPAEVEAEVEVTPAEAESAD